MRPKIATKNMFQRFGLDFAYVVKNMNKTWRIKYSRFNKKYFFGCKTI